MKHRIFLALLIALLALFVVLSPAASQPVTGRARLQWSYSPAPGVPPTVPVKIHPEGCGEDGCPMKPPVPGRLMRHP
jgi:hypothetical protein